MPERGQSFYSSCMMLLTEAHLQAKKVFFFKKAGEGDQQVSFLSSKRQAPLEFAFGSFPVPSSSYYILFRVFDYYLWKSLW